MYGWSLVKPPGDNSDERPLAIGKRFELPCGRTDLLAYRAELLVGAQRENAPWLAGERGKPPQLLDLTGLKPL